MCKAPPSSWILGDVEILPTSSIMQVFLFIHLLIYSVSIH